MPGLNLGAGAQVKMGMQPSYGSMPNPTTSSQAGFGYAGSDAGASDGVGALLPNDPAGVTFFWGLAATGLLLFMYWSMPN